jgi:molybdopterin/thiamine biosynthesis adenylyltransferase
VTTPEPDLARSTFRTGQGTDGADRSTSIVVELDERFPFGPPRVRLDRDKGALSTVTPTFHLERDGHLCLYGSDVALGDPSCDWEEPRKFLQRVAGWLQMTDAGWPSDTDTDLERYLSSSGELVVYDSSDLKNKVGFVSSLRAGHVLRVRWDRPFLPPKSGNKSVRRRFAGADKLAVVVDAGEVHRPITTWPELCKAIGTAALELRGLVQPRHRLRLVLVLYKRNGECGLLALQCRPDTDVTGGIQLSAIEAADESISSRVLRAGRQSKTLAARRVAVVGCGAIGSFTADILFRSGISQLTLQDAQRLRPGNLVRHLATEEELGDFKANAVRERLRATGIPVSQVGVVTGSLSTPEQALALLKSHCVVVDATGDGQATGLLQWAAQQSGAWLVSVCVQREGGIARVDRWPLHDGETHRAAVPELKDRAPSVRERGCGDIVSLTPPGSVVSAAALAARATIALLAGSDVAPTLIQVLKTQPDPPYDRTGLVAA